MNEYRRIIGVDPGNAICGLCVIEDAKIIAAFNVSNELFFGKIQNYLIHPNCTIALEDIRPYSLRLTPQVIDTCKFIGEAVYRLRIVSGATVETVARNEVKKWVFDTFPDVCCPRIEDKILKKGYITASTGDPRKPSFVFVDDKLVTESMKVLYGLEKPAPGKGYDHGLKDHSWQALAVASFWYHKQNKPIPFISISE